MQAAQKLLGAAVLDPVLASTRVVPIILAADCVPVVQSGLGPQIFILVTRVRIPSGIPQACRCNRRQAGSFAGKEASRPVVSLRACMLQSASHLAPPKRACALASWLAGSRAPLSRFAVCCTRGGLRGFLCALRPPSSVRELAPRAKRSGAPRASVGWPTARRLPIAA